ncbi:hypothetical protein ACEN9X_28245 [Mucilaginibacter sp. Mucisp86]|uniref:hypothetical protein n=1 Tax=Mucilaginibacter sp. Mucisp86 TaxID=3243060 RepID=UPI0039B3F846
MPVYFVVFRNTILIDHKLNQRYKDVMHAGISQRAKATIPGVFRDKIISAARLLRAQPQTGAGISVG